MKHVIDQILIEFHKTYPNIKTPIVKFNNSLPMIAWQYVQQKNSQVYIELNLKYLNTEEKVKLILTHELKHLVYNQLTMEYHKKRIEK